MRSVSEHQRVVSQLISARPAANVGLADSLGLVLADDVIAPLSLPVFDNSAMDGYAVRVEDVIGADPANPVKLPVAEDIPAGRTDLLTLAPGTAHRIMTGAPMPSGATAVIAVENTDAGIDTVTISASAKPGQHIRGAGGDVTIGSTVLRAGDTVTPAALGLVAALGLGELAVIPRQRVLVISTGSELVAAGTALQPGQIYESNAVMLAAAVSDADDGDFDFVEFRSGEIAHVFGTRGAGRRGGLGAGEGGQRGQSGGEAAEGFDEAAAGCRGRGIGFHCKMVRTLRPESGGGFGSWQYPGAALLADAAFRAYAFSRKPKKHEPIIPENHRLLENLLRLERRHPCHHAQIWPRL